MDLTATTVSRGGQTMPARRIVVVGQSGTFIVTNPDGTTVTYSAAALALLGGVIDQQCVAIQSAACTDIYVYF